MDAVTISKRLVRGDEAPPFDIDADGIAMLETVESESTFAELDSA